MTAHAINAEVGAAMRRPLSWLQWKRVDRLVAAAVLGAVALAWVVIVGIDALRTLVGELDDVGQQGYTLGRAVLYVVCTVPRRFYEMFGYAALIGSLLGLGGLASTGELTALRAAGLSKLRICASVVVTIAALTAGVIVLGETLGPWGERRAQQVLLAAKSRDVALTRGMLWARDGETVIGARTAHVQGSADQVELDGVRVFEFDADGRLIALSFAKRARHSDHAWAFEQVRRTRFGVDGASSSTEASTKWDSQLDPTLLSTSIVKPRYMALRELGRNIDALTRNRQDASMFRGMWWQRVFYPLSILVPTFCALPFAFGALRSGGLSKRLFLGVLLALGFFLLQRSVINLATVYDVAPALANLLPPLLLIAAAAAYFRRRA
ncbi:LPS export ABC transporter permease LptG [Dokdonella sp.]|uniref:LPS export ABC transporter permease LptG n=1 Tax=Dokdonella sp. TaxID=2291710 RepID=UPI0025B98DFA|nr:LPS export ABC transporter permease LptG [Dokdonella sp.]